MGLAPRSRRLNIDAVIAAVPGLRSRPVEGHVDVLSFAQLHGRQLGEVQTQAGVARAKVGDLLPAVHSIVHERGLGKADAKALPGAQSAPRESRCPDDTIHCRAMAAVALPRGL